MPFPNSPTNGELATVNNIVYVYNSTKNVWNKANISTPIITNSISISGNISTSSDLNVSGNLRFAGTSNRISGDFSNGTISNRVMFQTSTVNGPTNVYAIPNGSGTTSVYSVSSSSDPNNASIGQLAQTSTDLRIQNVLTGTGSYLPVTIYTGGSERVRVETGGNVSVTGNVIAGDFYTATRSLSSQLRAIAYAQAMILGS